jgi:hypothetical protein
MLGLSSGLHYGGGKTQELIINYTSDFSSTIQSWEAYSVEDSASDLTITANANPYTDLGGSTPNSSGWLKCVYGVEQTNASGVKIDTNDSPISVNSTTGDIWEFSFDIVLNAGSNWTNFSSNIDVSYQAANTGGPNTNVDPLTATTFTATDKVQTGSAPDELKIKFSGTQKPKAGAVFYIKNVTIKVFR